MFKIQANCPCDSKIVTFVTNYIDNDNFNFTDEVVKADTFSYKQAINISNYIKNTYSHPLFGLNVKVVKNI